MISPLRRIARHCFGATAGARVSPVSRAALAVPFVLLAIGVAASLATSFTLASLPNIVLLIIGILVLDVASQKLPQVKIVAAFQTFLYGFLFLVTTCVCGVLAAYALQRMAFPLRDEFLMHADRMLGFDWFSYVHWVDRHPSVQVVVRFAYDTIAFQIALPAVVLSLSGRIAELRHYILAFAIAFGVTIVISATMPAAGPIVFADRSAFSILHFTGATPIDHLTRLREAGPLLMEDFPGGIATFPSFHSTVAVLTPLALRSHRRIFACLLLLNAAMLAGTISEGAHYLIDTIAGSGMALFGYALARPILRAEDSRQRLSQAQTVPAYANS
jgi:hypothetical protein